MSREKPEAGSVTLAGRYRLEQRIARGGMAEIWRARDLEDGARVAVKRLLRGTELDEERRERLIREAAAIQRLSHPGIIRCRDVGFDDEDHPYLVLEWLDGEDLARRQRRSALSLARSLELTCQVLSGLECCHNEGIVHRDLKPGNVFLLKGQDPLRVKLLDFGVAWIDARLTRLTQTGFVMGSLNYLSPEQVEADGAIDHRTDIYAAGVLLYELVTGQLPFAGEEPMTVMLKLISETPTLPSLLNPGLPVWLDEVIMHAMMRSPSDRYPSAAEMRDEILARVAEMEAAGERVEDVRAAPAAPPAPAASESRRVSLLCVEPGAGEAAGACEAIDAAGGICQRLASGQVVGLFGAEPGAGAEALSAVKVGQELLSTLKGDTRILAATMTLEEGPGLRFDAAELDTVSRSLLAAPAAELVVDNATRDLVSDGDSGIVLKQVTRRQSVVDRDLDTVSMGSERVAFEGPGPVVKQGEMVDHFRVIRLLGTGGMGEVHLARDTKLGRKVALKLIRPRLLGSRDAIVRFMFEARATARFNHPHIVTIHYVGDHHGVPYVALEFLEGQDLRGRLGEGRLGLNEAMRVAAAMAEALTEAHDHDILHRDLKPENVFIPRDGRVRVVDFGMAMRLEASGRDELDWAADTDQVETTRGLKGTPSYMAPEQWQERECSGATDIWALGTVLFELITSRLPCEERSIARLAMAVTDPAPFPRVDEICPAPPELSELVGDCLQKDPADRPTAVEVAERLRRLLNPLAWREGLDRENPYRGLLAFTEEQAPFFFGRESEVFAFLEQIRHQPVLPVVGPSGAGKSSFVQAGVIPRLREQERWIVLGLRPGSRPFEALSTRLLQKKSRMKTGGVPTDTLAVKSEDVGALASRLRQSPGQLSLLLQAIAEEEEARVLLVVDQLEEIFTLVDDRTTRQRFVESILTAAGDAAEPLRVVFTIRDDYLGRLAFSPQARAVLREVTVLQNLGQQALEEILQRPLDVVGYSFEDHGLVKEMVEAVSDEPASLPLLQFAARMLWDRRDERRKLLLREPYEQMGRVEGALARHADGVLDGLAPPEVEAARQLLLRLVTAGRTRRITPAADALDGLGAAGERALARLTQARLVAVSRSRGASKDESLLELAHESLIHNWSTLSRWIDESREELVFLAEVGQAADLWDRRGRRPAELWEGEALQEALRTLRRCSTHAPVQVEEFLARGRDRQRQQGRRRRRLVGAGFAVLILIAAASVVAALVVREQRTRAEQQEAEAQRQRRRAQHRRAEALSEGARSAASGGRLLEARAKLRAVLESEDSALARALWWKVRDDPLVWSHDLGAVTYALDYAPDGQTVAVACQDAAIYLFDVQTGQARVLRGHDDQVFEVTFSADGKTLASGSWSGKIILWDVASGRMIRSMAGHASGITSLAMDPAGSILAAGSKGIGVRLWDVSTGKALGKFSSAGRVLDLRFSADGRRLALGSGSGIVELWSVSPRRLIRKLSGHAASVYGLRFSQDGERLVTGSYDRTVRLWSVNTGKQLRVLSAPASVYAISLAQGDRLVAAASGGVITLWDVTTGKVAGRFTGHSEAVKGLEFSPDGKKLASTGNDRTVRLWDLAHRERRRVLGGHAGAVRDLAFSPDGKRIASGGGDSRAILWDVRSGDEARILRGGGAHGATVSSLSFSPDGSTLATSGDGNSVRLWDVLTGKYRRLMGEAGVPVLGVRFGPGGQRLVMTSSDIKVRILPLKGGARRTLSGHRGYVVSACFSPDGRLVAAGSLDTNIMIWDARAGTVLRRLTGHTGTVFDVNFSHDGRRLASASSDGSVRLWDVKTGGALRVIGRHASRVYSVAFHPDGRRVGTGSADGTARIWDIDSGGHLELRGHADEVNRVAFSPDGQLMASASDDGTLRVWTVKTGRPFWRSPLLLSASAPAEPPELYSHLGWRRLEPGGGERTPAAAGTPAGWRRAVARQARQATQTGQTLCITTFDEAVELWDLATDRRIVRREMKGIARAVAFPGGCVVRSPEEALLVPRSGAVRALPVKGKVTAAAYGQGRILVAAGADVYAFDSAGASMVRRPAGVGITAVARLARWIVVGYRDGNIELLPADPASRQPRFSFERVPSSAVLSIIAGPMKTLAVGFASGVVGIWSLEDGKRLEHARIHGPVIHLLLRRHTLYAATGLGQHLSWDLGVFHADRCELLRQIWRRVPVLWDRGNPALRSPPQRHDCRRGVRR